MLITGDAGYIGTHLRKLFPDAEGCDLKRGEDYRSIHSREFDVVVHLAASVSVTGSMENPLHHFQNNALGIGTFLSENKVGRLIFMSTCGLYGDAHLAVEGDAKWEHCLSPYAQSKLLAESLIDRYHQSGDYAILRLGNVFGGDYTNRGEAAVHPNFEKDNPIVVYGGTQTRDFVHVGVVCHAIKAAVEGGMTGIYNIATGQETSIAKLAESYGLMRGVPVEYRLARAGEIEFSSLNCGRALNAGLIDPNPASSAEVFASKLIVV